MKKNAKARSRRFGPLLQISLICIVTYVALVAVLFLGVTPEQYDIRVGMPAPTDIKATKDIQDTVTTDALREEAAAGIEPSYKSADPTVITSVMSDLSRSFEGLRTLREMYGSADQVDDEAVVEVFDALSFTLNRDQLITLAETSESTLENVFSEASTAVRQVLNSSLPEGQEAKALKSIRSELSSSAQLSNIVMESVRTCLRPNMLIDEEVTNAKREEAREAVQAKWYVKDQVIVNEGQIVTQAQYTVISNLGILDEDTFDIQLFCGLAIFVLVLLLALGIYLYQFSREVLESPKSMTLLCLILLSVVALSFGMRMLHNYLMPVSLGLLLVALLMDCRLAVFINLILALLVSPLMTAATSTFTYVLMAAVCGPCIALLFSRKTIRTTTVLAGAIIGVVNFVITTAIGFINSAELMDVLYNAGIAAVNGIVCAVICIGMQPVLEALFNLATASKLIELSNPNHPLLRRLLLEASGTYHHSIIVANLAEAACTAVGANGLLARVGSYYHDIGKLKRPMYFKENQMGDNPHDRTDPRVSTAILTAHTRDGAQMAQKARIPEAVVDIIRQHHGDTPVMFFYDKAQKLYGDQVDIAAFRYEGPRPQSREAAIVSLADTVEAATRALPNPDPEKIDALIHKLVRGKLNDGQLDNSNLTFNDLDKISSAFSTVLTGVFHERIEYPDITIPPRLEKPDAQPEASSEEKPAAPAHSDAVRVEEVTVKESVERSEELDRAAAPAVKGKPAEAAAAPEAKAGEAVIKKNSEQEATEKPAQQSRPVVTMGAPVPPVKEKVEDLRGEAENHGN